MWENFLCIFECLLTQNPTNKAVNSLDSSRTYGWVLENPAARGSRELFLPANDFKTCYAAGFPKKLPDFGGLETKQRHELQTWFFFTCPSTHELNVI